MKIVAEGVKAPWELYNIRNDRSEMHDLASQNVQKVREMASVWSAHEGEFELAAFSEAPPGIKTRTYIEIRPAPTVPSPRGTRSKITCPYEPLEDVE